MIFINEIIQFFSLFFYFINTKNIIILSVLLILLYHIFVYIIRDRSYIKVIKNNKDIDTIKIKDLKNKPLVNILIPAWKEGEIFKNCLESIINLKYPKVKVIINAGGNEDTINIAESFKKYDNFIVLRQTGGKSRAALGKISALNECLNYVSEGLLYLIDADCYVTDEILVRMVYPIINNNENIVVSSGIRPLKSQEPIDLVNYLFVTRLGFSRLKFMRYSTRQIGGATTCITYEVIKAIGKFNQNRIIAEDVSRGQDILEKGFKIFCLTDFRSRLYTEYPKNFKELFEQRKRYIENTLINASYSKKKMPYVKFLLLSFVSLYFLISPVFIFLNFGLFLVGLYIFLFIYLRRIRKFIFFRRIVSKQEYPRFHPILFIKMLFYIYFEILINIITLFSLRTSRKKLLQEKNSS